MVLIINIVSEKNQKKINNMEGIYYPLSLSPSQESKLKDSLIEYGKEKIKNLKIDLSKRKKRNKS
jgi:uncharacterized membrane protein